MAAQSIATESLLGTFNEIERKFASAMLSCAGDFKLAKAPKVSVIGTRHPSDDDRELAAEFTRKLVAEQICTLVAL